MVGKIICHFSSSFTRYYQTRILSKFESNENNYNCINLSIKITISGIQVFEPVEFIIERRN